MIEYRQARDVPQDYLLAALRGHLVRSYPSTEIDSMIRVDARSRSLAVVAIVAAAVFIRLGTWQLDRLVERRDRNADHAVLAAAAPLDLPGTSSMTPTDSLLWRRVRLTGTWDFDSEIVIRGRAAFGSPGVHVVTPLRLEGGPAVLVLRGWLPAADGLSADLQSARPAPDDPGRSHPVVVSGRVLPGEPSSAIPQRSIRFEAGVHLVLGSLDLEAARRDLDDPILNAWVLPDSSTYPGEDGVPRPVEAIPPSDGPHLMYAIQWFGFAAITLAGATLFLISRHSDSQEGDQL
ncbi:SURF1 family protein [Gemmatimonadota bacterium]